MLDFWKRIKPDFQGQDSIQHFAVDKKYLLVRYQVSGDPRDYDLRIASDTDGSISEAILPSTTTLVELPNSVNTYRLYAISPKSKKINIEKIRIKPTDDYRITKRHLTHSDTLVITPSYPSDNIPQLATFVHTKTKQLRKFGKRVDIAVVNYERKLYKYKYDGVTVTKMSYDELQENIEHGRYRNIIVHFVNSEIARAVLKSRQPHQRIFIYCHGADVDLWTPDVYSPYFSGDVTFSKEEISAKKERTKYLRMLNGTDNVVWIFNTEWSYKNAKKVSGINFKKHLIVPCQVDREVFNYQVKTASKRKKILIAKKMDNYRSYAVDLAVEIVKKLSKKEFFHDLDITVVGGGALQEELTNPLKDFPNVKIAKRAVSPSEMSALFSQNGILLAPSRYDTQGLTACEAAFAGLVVVASTGTGLSELLPEKIGTFFDNDRLSGAVKIIEELYREPDTFTATSQRSHQEIDGSLSMDGAFADVDYLV